MTREALIKSVKKKYAGADVATIDAVLKTLTENDTDLAIPGKQKTSGSNDRPRQRAKKPKRELLFIGNNPAPEDFSKLSFEERGALKQKLKAKNSQWLAQKFSFHEVAWLVVIDGKVIDAGDSLKTVPQIERINEFIVLYGKQPFVFINDAFITIEESHIDWHPTKYANDFYPTVSLALESDSGSVEITADFDTGASTSLVDFDLLRIHRVVELYKNEDVDLSQHLGETFFYVNRIVSVEVRLSTGETLSRKLPFHCVSNWQNSPFISINPKRQALAGRDLFLELKPDILLSFANRHTKLLAPDKPA